MNRITKLIKIIECPEIKEHDKDQKKCSFEIEDNQFKKIINKKISIEFQEFIFNLINILKEKLQNYI